MSVTAANPIDTMWPPWGQPPQVPWRRLWGNLQFNAARAHGKPSEPTRQDADEAIRKIPDNEPDRELLAVVLAEYPHGTKGFTELVRQQWGRVWTICQSLLLNEHDAEEAAQDTFLKVHRNLLTFRFEARFSTWITQIARNTALTKLTSRRRQQATKERVTEDPSLAVTWIPKSNPHPVQQRSPMWRALAQLSPEDRFLLGMRDIEGHAYEEIADALGISAGAARMRASRARERMRQTLGSIREQDMDS